MRSIAGHQPFVQTYSQKTPKALPFQSVLRNELRCSHVETYWLVAPQLCSLNQWRAGKSYFHLRNFRKRRRSGPSSAREDDAHERLGQKPSGGRSVAAAKSEVFGILEQQQRPGEKKKQRLRVSAGWAGQKAGCADE